MATQSLVIVTVNSDTCDHIKHVQLKPCQVSWKYSAAKLYFIVFITLHIVSE